jgi:glucose/arabinose dehydrogenase
VQSTRARGLTLVVLSLLAVSCGLLPASTRAQTPFTVKLTPFASGFRQPLDVVSANDGSDRLFVVEKGGTIRVMHGNQLAEQPFLDLRAVVGARGSEQGLLGLAFHPQYAANGQFFVDYTDANGDTVVARYQVSTDPDVADAGTGTAIMSQDQPFPNHNGGNLIFGPDGYLWIGLGDGGSGGDPFGNAQNGGTWLGKMLRLDVDTPGASPEIWAMGLRNPWRYSFDRLTGDLWIGDVGQGEWEEIDYVPAPLASGPNFGWNVAEGNHCYNSRTCDLSPFAAPVAEYQHGSGDCAVIGGFVYRGSALPALQGVYLYADECTGRLWTLSPDANGTWSSAEQPRTGIAISSFGEDGQGEIYATGLSDGTLYRVELASQ